MKYLRIAALIGLPILLAENSVAEDKFAGDYSLGGWIRADDGNGDRYDESDGPDGQPGSPIQSKAGGIT